MTGGPHAAEITVRETLDLFDGALAETAAGIAEDRYALWLGSGISLGRIPGLKLLILRALEHLQGQVVAADGACRFRAAIVETLTTVAGLTADELNAIEVNQPVANWPNIDAIVARLASNYARFLEVSVANELDDYILWTGADLPNVFANPASEPDTEHLCIGLLILEGIASKIASANWDGLIEKAVDELSPGTDALLVCVIGADLRQPQRALVRVRKRQHWRPPLPLASTAGNSERNRRPPLLAICASASFENSGPCSRNLWLSATCAV